MRVSQKRTHCPQVSASQPPPPPPSAGRDSKAAADAEWTRTHARASMRALAKTASTPRMSAGPSIAGTHLELGVVVHEDGDNSDVRHKPVKAHRTRFSVKPNGAVRRTTSEHGADRSGEWAYPRARPTTSLGRSHICPCYRVLDQGGGVSECAIVFLCRCCCCCIGRGALLALPSASRKDRGPPRRATHRCIKPSVIDGVVVSLCEELELARFSTTGGTLW